MCKQWRSKKEWLPSQYHYRDPDWSGRDRCRECWAKGPDKEAMAYMHPDEWLNSYIMQHYSTAQIDVYLRFHGDNELKRGKDWSHYGALPWRMPRDQKDYDELNEAEPNEIKWFDPGNANYKQAVLFVDKTKEIEKQTGLTDEEKVADIVEGLLGIKWCVERGKGPPEIKDIHQYLIPDIPLTLDDIVCFWTTVAYAIYHKNLVWQWFQSTHIKSRIAAERHLEESSVVLQSARKRKRDEEETHKEILFFELFNTVATLMQHFYDQKIRA